MSEYSLGEKARLFLFRAVIFWPVVATLLPAQAAVAGQNGQVLAYFALFAVNWFVAILYFGIRYGWRDTSHNFAKGITVEMQRAIQTIDPFQDP